MQSIRGSWLLIGMALAIPLCAVDGVVLINQNAALAGNVTPGDAPGFPVTISVAGSYRLSGNLTVPDANTTAIQITADNVTIDLNGFSIIGPTLCGGPPITCSPTGSGNGIAGLVVRATVLNGYIRGMGASGISLSGFNHVEKIHASSNGSAGIRSGGGIVSSCVAEFNGGDGIRAEGGRVSDNVAIENGGNGIALTFQGVITNNQADHNGGNGIAQTFAPVGVGSMFSGNSATFNGGIGISAVCPSLITANSVTGNPGGDIFTAGSGCIRSNNLPAP